MATPPHSADAQLNAQLAALLRAAAIAPLDDIGWVRVAGSDRLRWLNGMVTNSIQQLAPGEGCYNFALNAQGRILGDLTAFLLEDSILLETGRDQVPALLAHLDRFIIMDDVELSDIGDRRQGIVVAGPQAASVLGRLGLPATPHSPLRLQSATWKTEPLDILNAHSPLVPRYELWAGPTTVQQLHAAILAAGAILVSPAALEQLRILEGIPRYGVDIRDRDLPQETSPIGVQTRALHFTKGCYLGQEIVERIRSRGNVHRTLSGFVLTGSLPAPGAVLEAESRPVGELSSVASIHLPEPTAAAAPSPLQLALGLIRREALERNLTLIYPGGVATPTALPYAVP